jgi:hypothetical protein
MSQPNFSKDVLTLQQITPHLSKTNTLYPTYSPSEVPKEHWCGHYLDPKDKTIIIKDGADCCFWHWIGLPQRWGVRHPAYPWQEKLFDEYFKQNILYYYIGKVPKIGASRTWIGIAIHEALTNPNWINGQVGIVVGTGGNEAEKMIERCKELISYKDHRGVPLRDDKGQLITKFPINEDYNTKKEFSLNSVEFRAYPANNVDSIRSKENMVLEIVDEIGFFTMIEQQRVRDAFEHYIGNSNVRIALITTAGKAASGVAYEIETENPSIYSHHLLEYTLGLEEHPESKTTLFNLTELKKLMTSSSWTRNYLRVWGHGSGNIYNSEIIDEISSTHYPMVDIRGYENVLGLDPAYGKVRTKTSSKFGGFGMWKENGEYYERSSFELEECPMDEALDRIKQEISTFGYKNVIVDGAHPGVISAVDKIPGVHCYGVPYNVHGLAMTDESADAVHQKKVHLNPNNQEIKNQLKSIRRNDKGMPNKDLSRFDMGDSFQQCIHHFVKGGNFVARRIMAKR